jgi:DNA invertase Pin-like site-specific DNA recombinase
MRISTKEERELQSYKRQENAINKYVDKNGIDVTLMLKEDKSGKSFKGRKEWGKIEKLAQSGDTIIFKDVSRFTREAENGYNKYVELMEKGINLVFLDNPTVCTDYIKSLLKVAQEQDLLAKMSIEYTVKLLIMVELDRVEKERLTISQRTKDGMLARKEAKEEQGIYAKPGRKPGTMEKMSDKLKEDIKAYINDRSIKQVDLMKEHNISRNTLKKYVAIVQEQETAQ